METWPLFSTLRICPKLGRIAAVLYFAVSKIYFAIWRDCLYNILCKLRQKRFQVTDAFLITKRLDDFGITKHETAVPILRLPAIAFLYILGKAEAEGQNGKL